MSLRKYSSKPLQQTLPVLCQALSATLSLQPNPKPLRSPTKQTLSRPKGRRFPLIFLTQKTQKPRMRRHQINSMQLLYCHGSESNLYKWRVFVPYYPLNPLTNKILFIFSMNWSKKLVKKHSLVVIQKLYCAIKTRLYIQSPLEYRGLQSITEVNLASNGIETFQRL